MDTRKWTDGLKGLLASRKGMALIAVILLSLVVLYIGITERDFNLVITALVTLAGAAGLFMLCVAWEDAAESRSFTEAQETTILDMVERVAGWLKADPVLREQARAFFDWMIVTEEEAAEQQPTTWPRAEKPGNSGPLPPGMGGTPQYPLAG